MSQETNNSSPKLASKIGLRKQGEMVLQAKRHAGFTIEVVKLAVKGQWEPVLMRAGLSAEQLNGKGQPCPKCGGTDRYNAAADVADTGAVFCRHCFCKGAKYTPGDGIATVAWLLGISNGEAMKWVLDQFRYDPGQPSNAGFIEELCKDKSMPRKAFGQFGVEVVRATRLKKFRRVCRIAVYNEKGEVHSYFDLWPGDKGRFKPGKGSSGMFFPGRLPESGETWILVEGVKDASAVLDLGFNAAGMPMNMLNAKYAGLFKDVNVIILHDLDKAGVDGAERTAANLYEAAASVAIASMDGEFKTKGGDDVRDVLSKPNGKEIVTNAINGAAAWEPSPADALAPALKIGMKGEGSEKQSSAEERQIPTVTLTMEEHLAIDQVITHLASLGWSTEPDPQTNLDLDRIYERNGVLVEAIYVLQPDGSNQLMIRELPQCKIRERITKAVSLETVRMTDEGPVVSEARPPRWLYESIQKRGSFDRRMQPLFAIVEWPTIIADGTVLQERGYDDNSNLIYHPTMEFPRIPDAPTREHAKVALETLYEVVADFPFYDDADRSAWVAMVLSMLNRRSVDGCVPLFAVTANIRAAGKSKLVDAASSIAYGKPAARKAFTSDDDEQRKGITAIALEAIPCVLFDNLDIPLAGGPLDAALTGTTWSDRVLGKSATTGELMMQTVWCATGNNLRFGSDVSRRVLPIRLQSPLEKPEDREGFKHPDLLAWVAENRANLIVAALTILRAYFVAGRPKQDGERWGSFENWSATIRGAIVWAGAADPLRTRELTAKADDSASLLGKLIKGIENADHIGVGLTTREIENLVTGPKADDREVELLVDAVKEICGERFNSRRVGRTLSGFTQRVHEGKFISAETVRGGVKCWRIKTADEGFGGFEGLQTSTATAQHPSTKSQENSAEETPSDAIENQPNPTNPPAVAETAAQEVEI